MLRISRLLPFTLALVCGLTVMASATSRVIISVDLPCRNTPVTLTVQNAEINDVLSALFNATNNTYQLQTGLGVTGYIDTLQLTRAPFDDALTAILAKVNTTFTYSKTQGGLYCVTNPAGATTGAPVPVLFVPAINDPDMVVSGKLTLPIIKDKDAKPGDAKAGKDKSKPAGTDTTASDPLLGGDDTATGDKTGKDDAKTTEECYLAMIKIRHQPVHVFAVGFGADELPDFSILSNPNGTTGTTGTGGTGYNGLTSGSGLTSPYGTSPYGTSPYGTSQYGTSPYGTSPYGTSPYGTSPYGTSPYGTSPYGTSPYGTVVVTTGTTTTGGR